MRRTMLIAAYAAGLLVLGYWMGEHHAVTQDASARVQAVRP